MPTADPEELFAPFVSQKKDGLGMGLTITRTIVEAHDGKVWGEVNVPLGATFIVRIPAA
ncbi:MAG: ATP-binding protein [Gemmatimonadetes bacterium]|nr:ATP-binding protein [Gemmatimonadota bacterium]MDA1102142.1 ATP-binding protein [Gemmatimonadota bacterium]